VTGVQTCALPICTLPRPAKELKGFTKVHLLPGESRTVSLSLDMSALSYYDPAKHVWTAEPGEFNVLVGSSAADIHLRGAFRLVGSGKTAGKKT